MKHRNIHLDTGAYALNALPAREHTEFSRHLRTCDSCAAEVRELVATAARLGGAAADDRPPPEVRDRVLQGIRGVRQERPAPPPPAWTDRITRRLPGFALAASVALAAVFGGVAWWQHDQAQDARARQQASDTAQARLTGVLTAPDARTTVARLSGGAAATVVYSARRNQAVLIASDMTAPPSGSVYQVWFDHTGHMTPAGLMDPARTSSAVLLDAVDGASGVGITVEPTGGSVQPTSAPIALLPFAT
ncbi:anti-sigma factor [Uniformispora flossi]|uniref:anti-sigma factor n=1 Tax=Uniformispora flossi TaxID=3390723 RepID=UPI003C2F5212